MNSQDGSFFKYDKTFASDLYLINPLNSGLQCEDEGRDEEAL
jgi:hypothetical protein